MSEFKTKLLNKYLNSEYFNDFEQKKFDEYVNKTNVFTYCKHENDLHLLNKDYVEWCKIKIMRLNKELSKDNNIVKFLQK